LEISLSDLGRGLRGRGLFVGDATPALVDAGHSFASASLCGFDRGERAGSASDGKNQKEDNEESEVLKEIARLFL
jgi:hypothetical protein